MRQRRDSPGRSWRCPSAGDGVVPPLTKALEDENASVRYYAAEALWHMGVLGHIGAQAKHPVPALVIMLHDTDEQVTFMAALALVGLSESEQIAPIRKELVLVLRSAMKNADGHRNRVNAAKMIEKLLLQGY